MSTITTVGMRLTKPDAQDFRTMWKVSKAFQNLGWADTDLRERRLERVLVGRLDQLGTSGFIRIVMGCELLIKLVCDPEDDLYALKPVYGAAHELLEAALRLEGRGFFNPVSCADAATLEDMKRMRLALLAAAQQGKENAESLPNGVGNVKVAAGGAV